MCWDRKCKIEMNSVEKDTKSLIVQKNTISLFILQTNFAFAKNAISIVKFVCVRHFLMWDTQRDKYFFFFWMQTFETSWEEICQQNHESKGKLWIAQFHYMNFLAFHDKSHEKFSAKNVWELKFENQFRYCLQFLALQIKNNTINTKLWHSKRA